MRCLEKDAAVGQSFNIGNSHNTLTMYELAKRIIQLCGSQSKIVFQEINYSDVNVRVPNTLKARKLLDFYPKVEIDDAILHTKKWYEENFHKIDISYMNI